MPYREHEVLLLDASGHLLAASPRLRPGSPPPIPRSRALIVHAADIALYEAKATRGDAEFAAIYGKVE